MTVGGVIDRYGWAQASLIVAAAALGGVAIAWRLRRLNGARL